MVYFFVWLLSAELFSDSSIFLQVSVRHYFLLLSRILLYGYSTIYLFTYLLMDFCVLFDFWLL